MAPTIQPTPRLLISHHRASRFLISRKNLLDKPWSNNANASHRLPVLFHYRFHPLPYSLPLCSRDSSLSLCSRDSLFYPPLCSLFRTRSPPFLAPLSSVTNPQAATDSPHSPPTKTVRVVIKGRVQGVFYRNWTVENAIQLGLNGWVRNRRDGSVEALFSGKLDSVQGMEQRCRRGPPAAMVTEFQVFPCSDDPGTGLEGKPTA